MRRGQSRGRAADLLPDSTGRLLVTIQTAAVIERRHVNVVRRYAVRVGHVACDVRTGALLYDAVALADALKLTRRQKGPEWQERHTGTRSRTVA